MITIWNHTGLAQRGRAVALPALRNYQTATSSLLLYTLPHCTQHQCVYWIQDPVINKFSIFCSPRCLANIKGGKGWCGISVCRSILLLKKKNSPVFSPKIQAESSKFNFMTTTFGTWQIGPRFVSFRRFCLHLVKNRSHQTWGSDMKTPGSFMKSTHFGKSTKNVAHLSHYGKKMGN